MKITFKTGKGINRDALPSELEPGVWSDCQNMRFRNGADERVGGLAAVFTTPLVTPYWLQMLSVGGASANSRYLVQGGLAKVYVDDGTTQTQITRYTDGIAISSITRVTNTINNISNVGTTATLTTAGDHGWSVGDPITVSGATPAAYNGAFTIASVPLANQFTYTMLTDPGGPATVVGTLYTVATVTTNSAHGRSAGQSVRVYGVTPTGYNGTQTVQVPTTTTFKFQLAADPGGSATVLGYYEYLVQSDFTLTAADRWTGGVLGGILIANSPVDGMYYWAGDTSLRMRPFFDNTTRFVCEVARVYRNYVVMLGKRDSTSATKRPYRINWSKAQEPGSVPSNSDFTADTDNDAGSVDKAETAGVMVDAAAYGDALIVYKEDARIAMQWIGGNDVFSFRYLPGTDGLLAVDCVVNTPKGQVFLTQNLDVKIHQGGEAESIIDGRNLNWLRANIDATYYKRSFLAVNRKFSEVWVCFPATGSSTCNKALLWNWNDNTWGERDLSGVTFGTSGLLPTNIATDERLILSTTTPRIGLVDSGTTDFGSAFTSMVERKGISADDPETVKNLQGTRWQDDGTAGAVSTVYHGSAMTADGTVTYATGVSNTLGTTNWSNTRATGGRYMAIKRSTTAEIGRCRSIDIDFTVSGSR